MPLKQANGTQWEAILTSTEYCYYSLSLWSDSLCEWGKKFTQVWSLIQLGDYLSLKFYSTTLPLEQK